MNDLLRLLITMVIMVGTVVWLITTNRTTQSMWFLIGSITGWLLTIFNAVMKR